MNFYDNTSTPRFKRPEFFDYWESLGFFENIKFILPKEFFLLFEIARNIFAEDKETQAKSAVEEISKKDFIKSYDRDKSILINRIERPAPLANDMSIDRFRTIYDLKKALPRELVYETPVFDMKLFTRTLQVQRFYEQEEDQFKSVTSNTDKDGNAAFKFEQKFYLLLDRSRSMDLHMRAFYSKCIITEFLKNKFNSNAKIYYRPFDSDVGDIFITEKKSDFPILVEKVLLTTTGGSSTNMQKAILQAISDINYDKELLDAEILVVTDGVIDDLNKDKLIGSLKDIKLNILKIGRDMPEPNYYDMKSALAKKNINFDPQSVNLNEIKKKMAVPNRASLPESERPTYLEERLYQYLLECSDEITKTLREVARKFIEIDDLKKTDLFVLDDDTLFFIEKSVESFRVTNIESKNLNERTVLYKKVYFLHQYVEFLIDSLDKENPVLSKAHDELSAIKLEMLSDPFLYKIVTRIDGFEEDKKFMKETKKEYKKKRGELKKQNRVPTNAELEKAKLVLSMDISAEGNIWLIIRLIAMKIWAFLKKIYSFFRNIFSKDKKDAPPAL